MTRLHLPAADQVVDIRYIKTQYRTVRINIKVMSHKAQEKSLKKLLHVSRLVPSFAQLMAEPFAPLIPKF